MTIGGGSVGETCRYLRTKQTAPTVVDDLLVSWESGENAEAAFHCLLTQGPVGPDDRLVHAVECREGRACFRKRSGPAD